MDRDPRIDPRAGDVLVRNFGNGNVLVEVQGRGRSKVAYKSGVTTNFRSLDQWRETMKNAGVKYVAPDRKGAA